MSISSPSASRRSWRITWTRTSPSGSSLNVTARPLFEEETLEVDKKWIEQFLDRVRDAEVGISVELGRRQISIRDLLSLKIGDTLLLDKQASEPLVANVEGVPKFVGKAGVYGTNKAIQIEGRITPP